MFFGESHAHTMIEALRIGPEKNFTYLIYCPKKDEAALIDPSFDFEKVEKWVSQKTGSSKTKMKYLIATHGHWDHAGGFNEMLQHFPEAQVLANENERKRL